MAYYDGLPSIRTLEQYRAWLASRDADGPQVFITTDLYEQFPNGCHVLRDSREWRAYRDFVEPAVEEFRRLQRMAEVHEGA